MPISNKTFQHRNAKDMFVIAKKQYHHYTVCSPESADAEVYCSTQFISRSQFYKGSLKRLSDFSNINIVSASKIQLQSDSISNFACVGVTSSA